MRARWLQGGADSGAAVHALPEGVEGDAVPAVSRQRATYWRDTRARGAVLSEAVASAPRADVVVTQLHGAPAAFAAGAPVVLLLPSYESLCKIALGVGATVRSDAFEPVCPPPRDCEGCPAARALADPERVALRAQRLAQDDALARAHTLVACSNAVAAAVRASSGRSAAVIASVAEAPAASGSHAGHVLVAAAAWGPHKGGDLVEPIVRGLGARAVTVTQAGLDDEARARLAPSGPVCATADWALVLERRPRVHRAVTLARAVLPDRLQLSLVAFRSLRRATEGCRTRSPGGLVDPAAGAAEYLAALAALDDEAAWSAASAQARDRAAAVVASRPLDRAVEAVEAAGQA